MAKTTLQEKIILNQIKQDYPDWQELGEEFLDKEVRVRVWSENVGQTLFTDLRCHTCGQRLNSSALFANICTDDYIALLKK